MCDLWVLLPEIIENAPNYTICLLLHKQVVSFIEPSVLEQNFFFFLVLNHNIYKVYITLTEIDGDDVLKTTTAGNLNSLRENVIQRANFRISF